MLLGISKASNPRGETSKNKGHKKWKGPDLQAAGTKKRPSRAKKKNKNADSREKKLAPLFAKLWTIPLPVTRGRQQLRALVESLGQPWRVEDMPGETVESRFFCESESLLFRRGSEVHQAANILLNRMRYAGWANVKSIQGHSPKSLAHLIVHALNDAEPPTRQPRS